MSDINDRVRAWFTNEASVTRNLGAIQMARQMKSLGKKFTHQYIGSGVPRKTYGAQAILDIARGIYDTSDATDVQFRELMVMQNNILGLYYGVRKARMMYANGRNHITVYQSFTFNSDGTVSTRGASRNYSALAIITLFNTKPASADYPIQTV